MKKSLLILPFVLLSLVSCTKNIPAVDYCKYAPVGWNGDGYISHSDQEIVECEVIKSESKKAEVMGVKLIAHAAELKFKIQQKKDECHSKKGILCNTLKRDCIMEDGKAADFCKYPDKKIINAKGAIIKEMRRHIELAQQPEGEYKVDVMVNKQLK